MALGSRIGSLYVRVGADTRQFHRAMDRANRPLEKFRVAAGAAVKAMAAVGAAATAAAGGVLALARSEMNLIDEQAKLARSIGGTVTGLRTLKLAAEDNGIDGLEGSLNRLNRRLGAVEMGGGPAAETVKRLGLNIKELSEMDIDDRLATIADTIRDSGISAQEAARHLQQLGFQQQEATTFFMQGGDAIRAARDEIEAFGLSVDMLDAAKMEEANTQFSRMSLIFQGLRTRLAVELAPAMLQTAQTLSNVAREMLALRDRTDDAHDAIDGLRQSPFVTDFVHPVIVGLARLLDVLVKVGQAVKAVGASFRAVAADISAFTSSNAIGQLNQQQQLQGQFGEFDTPGMGDQIIEGLQVDQEKVDKALEQHRAIVEERDQIIREANEAWDRLFNEPGNTYEQAALRGISTPLQEITVPGSGGTASDVDPDAKEREAAAKRELEENKRRLEALQQFLADRDSLEMMASAKRLADLRSVHSAGLVSEEQHLEMLAGLHAKHFEAMASLQDDDNREKMERLAELYELELLNFSEYSERQIEQILAHEEAQTQMALDAFEARKEILDELREISELEDEEYRERLRQAEQQLQDDLTMIAARGAAERNKVSAQEASERANVMKSMMGNLTQLMNTGSRTMFNIGKVAAVAQALLAGREAVVSSYKVGARIGGPALGAAFAATAAAATAAQIASLRNTTFGGGGGVSSSGGGGAVYTRPTDAISDPPVNPESQQRTAVTINLTGDVFSRQQVRELIEHINEATKDGAVLRLN